MIIKSIPQIEIAAVGKCLFNYGYCVWGLKYKNARQNGRAMLPCQSKIDIHLHSIIFALERIKRECTAIIYTDVKFIEKVWKNVRKYGIASTPTGIELWKALNRIYASYHFTIEYCPEKLVMQRIRLEHFILEMDRALCFD